MRDISEFESEIDSASLDKAIKLIHSHTGITMSAQKKSLLQGRLRRRMRSLDIQKYNDYLEFVENNKAEIQHFINVVTTSETSFFRTERVWTFFQNEFLPDWYQKNNGKVFRVWSAASASGEEAYSIAICCLEFRLRNPGFKFEIFASDISTAVIEEAKLGVYSPKSVDAVKKTFLFDKYFKPAGTDSALNGDVKNCVEFFQQNLFVSVKATTPYDIVFLRNILIYFGQADQEKVIKNVCHTLAEGGLLIVGESESLSSLNINFNLKFERPFIYKVDRK